MLRMLETESAFPVEKINLHPEEIRILRISDQAVLPTRAHANDAGLDLYALDDFQLSPRLGEAVGTGIALAIPEGYVGLICDRSSMAKRGVKTAGGVIDAGYRGEIRVVLWNLSDEVIYLKRGDRIAQLLVLPIATPRVKEVKEFEETHRGSRGFGSTGR